MFHEIDKKYSNRGYKHLRIVTIIYVITCVVRITYDFMNLLIVNGDIKIGDDILSKSL